jgi:tRNA1Val (adenine37-N6)-methyltransferase
MITTVKSSNSFTFKQFTIKQDKCTMKVNTDGVLLGAWTNVSKVNRALDIGTGTGVIALMIAQRNQNALITGIDIDENSSIEALENVRNSIFNEQVEIKNISIQEFAISSPYIYDLIVSNPPFFTGGTFSANENKANVRHTIKLPHGDLLNAVNLLLSPHGNFSLVLPYIEGLRFIELAERSKLYVSDITEVRHRTAKPIERLLLNFKKNKQVINKDELYITTDGANNYSEKFQDLTKDFYIHF